MVNQCRIEIGDEVVVVEVDGIRAEARGELVEGVKREVALYLLRAMSQAPHIAEQARQRDWARARIEDENAMVAPGAIIGGLGHSFP